MLKHQLRSLLSMQDAMNAKVNANWIELGHEWYRAIWIECGEMLDHYGWKWWKAQECDLPQVELELIDILHFGLSDLIQKSSNVETLADELAQNWPVPADGKVFEDQLEAFAADCLATKSFNLALFVQLAHSINMSSDDLYVGYIAKNVLNRFRQDFGYKSGEYIKIWNGKEDNEVLVELCSTLDVRSEDFQTQLYNGLKAAYPV
ncbi:dUTP diphosphatase [Umboniibacter marinipuniceus]|uniref:Dimeric dUTPase (All-alpha-NTP-PPase superfamily) n=1 Tax=Umboniibacter marinipuniceus TaxID=569599 RepID=A0A3M0AQG8_9GAMM|nr:dUTP diphosphatase [Umboniibacter marinipuniceus]RMA81242.1 dimeric dUTPase (all-alpha-NTP-PPase superfamily) [Umboniibacter marinipuniceus]